MALKSLRAEDLALRRRNASCANSVDSVGIARRSFVANSCKGYGVALSSAATARERFYCRQHFVEQRIRISNWSVGVALLGLALAVIDVELRADDDQIQSCPFTQKINNYTTDTKKHISNILRSLVVLLTVFLDVLIIVHHVTESKILVTDTGQKTTILSRIACAKLILELFICSCCPFPALGSHSLRWPNFINNYQRTASNILAPVMYAGAMRVPLHVLLTVIMFCRLYLVCRFMVLHSDIHQDPSTRAIASFNQVLVDFPFVLKSLLSKRPLSILTAGTLSFWVVMTWIMTQCERYGKERDLNASILHNLFDYAWFEVVTFFAIGFGDIEIVTYCGRSVALLTGIAGTILTSLVTVIISNRMLLSLAERRVNQVIAESQLSKLHKNEAARVLQWAWRVVRLQRRYELLIFGRGGKRTLFQLCLAQRHLLIAIFSFRRYRWQLRQTLNEENDVITIQQAFSQTGDHLRAIRLRQQMLGVHVTQLAVTVERLGDAFDRKYPKCVRAPTIPVIVGKC